jgi:hypothetical protein
MEYFAQQLHGEWSPEEDSALNPREMLLFACEAGAAGINSEQRLENYHLAERIAMPSFDFKRLNRTMMIYRVVQALLVCLLLYVAYIFQTNFAQLGQPEKFISSMISAIVVQLLLLYPLYRLAWRDAGVEVEGCAAGLSAEMLAALRKKRMIGDLWKFSGVAFFLVFVTLIPDAKKATGAAQVLAITLFSFLLICLTYFQCYNFSARKRMKQAS